MVIIAREPGKITAAPMPCTARAPISQAPLLAEPAASDQAEERHTDHEQHLHPDNVAELAAGGCKDGQDQ